MKKAQSTILSMTGARKVKIEITGNDANKHIEGISKVVQKYLQENTDKKEMSKAIDDANKKLSKIKKHKDGMRIFISYLYALTSVHRGIDEKFAGFKVLNITLDTINYMDNQGCDFETAYDAVKASDRLANIAHSILSGE